MKQELIWDDDIESYVVDETQRLGEEYLRDDDDSLASLEVASEEWEWNNG